MEIVRRDKKPLYALPRIVGLHGDVVGVDGHQLLQVSEADGVQADAGVLPAELRGETPHSAAETLQQRGWG